jgi:hypothetical protein
MIISGKNKISLMRLLTLKSALKLEILGMHRSVSPSAYSIIKKELGFKGSRKKVLEQLEEHTKNRA